MCCVCYSLCDSRKSTPSPHSSSSDFAKAAKSDPSTPVDKSFVPISAEILAELADQGIDITEKHKCISDENKARLVKVIISKYSYDQFCNYSNLSVPCN